MIQVLLNIGDLSEEETCTTVVANTVSKFHQLDVLVNSAGILVTGSLEAMTLEDYDRQMNINVRSVIQACKLAAPHLITTKGNIVNVSSVTGLRAVSIFLPVIDFPVSQVGCILRIT